MPKFYEHITCWLFLYWGLIQYHEIVVRHSIHKRSKFFTIINNLIYSNLISHFAGFGIV